MLADAWNYVLAHPAQFYRALGVHVALSASALFIAALICIPAGIAVARKTACRWPSSTSPTSGARCPRWPCWRW
jgi:ABC-type proline/glycine betaine transport system permease subunit